MSGIDDDSDDRSSGGPGTPSSSRPDDPTTGDHLLELVDVDAGYGETRVLHGLSMYVDRGEIVSLVGRNGAGKTTTMRTVVGTIEPTAGRITYDGRDITATPSTETAKMGIALVPEERRIFPDLTVLENLELAAYGGGDNDPVVTVDEALETFENLGERRGNDGSALSGGEQQMLAIARALVGGADCILLDEPTEGLAPFIVQDVVDIVRDLNERGITVVLVEQNVHVALELADRNYVIDQGEIVYHGTSDELEDEREVLDRYLGVTA